MSRPATAAVLETGAEQKEPTGADAAMFWLLACAFQQRGRPAARRWTVCEDCENWRPYIELDGRCRYCKEPII